MAATGSPSHSQPQQRNDDDEDLQTQDPNSIQPQEAEQSPPRQPPNSETLDPSNPQQSPLHDEGVPNPQKLDKEEDTHDGDDQQSQQKDDLESGTTHSTIPEPIVLPEETKNPSPLPSPINTQRRITKRKKAGRSNANKRKKVQNLTDILKPIPFIPTKTLDFVKHEEVLKRLGLYDFSKIELDRDIRTDLVVQLIANYDQKKRASYVNDLRVGVNRADLARALKLPAAKPERASNSLVQEVDLDSEVFSDDAIGFIDDFVSNWILLHEDPWIMPPDLIKMTRCIKDGHPEKLDPARLIWHMVEKELTQGDKLTDCYYASHLQYLIRSQREELFMEEDEEEIERKEEEEDIEMKEEEKEETEMKEEDKEEKQEHEDKDKDLVVEEKVIQLTLGSDVNETVQEEVKKDDEVMVDAGDCKEEEVVAVVVEEEEHRSWNLNGKNELGNHFLQPCHSNLNDYSEQMVEEVEDEDEEEQELEQIQQVEDEEEVEEVEEEEEEEEEGERGDEGFDMEANDDSLDRDGLTGNFLQGVETSHNPFSGMDLFGSRDGSFMSHGGPSFFNNGKRVMETDDHITHHDPNPKRLKPNEIWDQKPSEFTACMDQIHQWMEKAKMIHESKEQVFETTQYHHQLAINQLQERQNFMEMVIKEKDEELAKKQTEMFRLERELYLMGDLVTGYRKALIDTRFKFSEYRKRYALHEEPLYKDAGPGGLVLSTRELEKQRVKQEEDRVKIVKMLNDYEEECVCQLEMYKGKVLEMSEKLVCIENEVKNVKEKYMERKLSVDAEKKDEGELLGVVEVHEKPVEDQEMEISVVDPETDQKLPEQKLPEQVIESEEKVESVPSDADESKEKGGGED